MVVRKTTNFVIGGTHGQAVAAPCCNVHFTNHLIQEGGKRRDDNDDDGVHDVQSIEFVIDCFRIVVRDTQEHHRPPRTGAGAGGWAMMAMAM